MTLPDSGRALADHARDAATLARPLETEQDLDPLVSRCADARVVLIGEASHGTSEYYRWRATLSKRLISEHGFSFVAVEGDWPDCRDVDRWVKGRADGDALRILETFERWPTWMWGNHEVAEFATWLRAHNQDRPAPVGFFGLDVYSLRESLAAVHDYVAEHLPEALEAARTASECFDVHGSAEQYAHAQRLVPASCEDEVVGLLEELRDTRGGGEDPDDRFDAEQNALVLRDAEQYYRVMLGGGTRPWNLRDTHMADTLDRLLEHHGPRSRGIVWEHNTHVGDARYTDMSASGLTNVGELTRLRHGADNVTLIGFGSFEGTVVAAAGWGRPPERKVVPPAVPHSHEDVIHTGVGRPCLFVFDEADTDWARSIRAHRAIGVVYHPERDPVANWVPTVIGSRYDAFCFFPHTEALHPLESLEPEEIPQGPVV